MAVEGVKLRDATQVGILLVTMIHKALFDESSIFDVDAHEMHYIANSVASASVLVDSHPFHPDWPYQDQVKEALATLQELQR